MPVASQFHIVTATAAAAAVRTAARRRTSLSRPLPRSSLSCMPSAPLCPACHHRQFTMSGGAPPQQSLSRSLPYSLLPLSFSSTVAISSSPSTAIGSSRGLLGRRRRQFQLLSPFSLLSRQARHGRNHSGFSAVDSQLRAAAVRRFRVCRSEQESSPSSPASSRSATSLSRCSASPNFRFSALGFLLLSALSLSPLQRSSRRLTVVSPLSKISAVRVAPSSSPHRLSIAVITCIQPPPSPQCSAVGVASQR